MACIVRRSPRIYTGENTDTGVETMPARQYLIEIKPQPSMTGILAPLARQRSSLPNIALTRYSDSQICCMHSSHHVRISIHSSWSELIVNQMQRKNEAFPCGVLNSSQCAAKNLFIQNSMNKLVRCRANKQKHRTYVGTLKITSPNFYITYKRVAESVVRIPYGILAWILFLAEILAVLPRMPVTTIPTTWTRLTCLLLFHLSLGHTWSMKTMLAAHTSTGAYIKS